VDGWEGETTDERGIDGLDVVLKDERDAVSGEELEG